MENQVISVWDRLSNSFILGFQKLSEVLSEFAPKLIGAIIVWIVGRFVAKILKKLVAKLLTKVKLNDLSEKIGISQALNSVGLKNGLIGLISTIVYWFVLLIFLFIVVDILGLEIINDLFNQIILFLPRIFVAIVIVVAGLGIGNLVKNGVETSLSSLEVSQSSLLGKLAKVAVLFVSIPMALAQLNIGGEIVTNAFTFLFGAICIALGLAFGLGGKDWAADVINKYLKK